MRLGPAEHLAWVRENYEAVLATPVDRLSAPLEDCPGWRVDTAIDHLARSAYAFRRFMTSAPHENPMADILAGLPLHASGAAAIDSATTHLEALLVTAAGIDPTTPCPFVTGPATVATWCWHMAAETWIHRADVGHALEQHAQLTPDRGMDCLRWSAMIRELIGVRLAAAPDAIDCVAVDSDGRVTVGAAPPLAEVRGQAGDLALRLWNRHHGPLDGDGFEVAAWANLKVISPLD